MCQSLSLFQEFWVVALFFSKCSERNLEGCLFYTYIHTHLHSQCSYTVYSIVNKIIIVIFLSIYKISIAFHLQTDLMYDLPSTHLWIYRTHLAFYFRLKSHLPKNLMTFLMVFLYQERSLVRENFASSRVTVKCCNVVFIFTGTTRNIVWIYWWIFWNPATSSYFYLCFTAEQKEVTFNLFLLLEKK